MYRDTSTAATVADDRLKQIVLSQAKSIETLSDSTKAQADEIKAQAAQIDTLTRQKRKAKKALTKAQAELKAAQARIAELESRIAFRPMLPRLNSSERSETPEDRPPFPRPDTASMLGRRESNLASVAAAAAGVDEDVSGEETARPTMVGRLRPSSLGMFRATVSKGLDEMDTDTETETKSPKTSGRRSP